MFCLRGFCGSHGYGKFGDLPQDELLLQRVTEDFHRRMKRWESSKPERGAHPYDPAINTLEGYLRSDIQQLVQNHLPAYEDTFLELDKRETTQEVYLGRDAIFMYYSRRAQLLARGEKTAKRILYLNYPRSIMGGSFTTEERIEYLQSAGIKDISKCVFIDTGYRGSIPRHIMSLFSIPEEEMRHHILMIKSSAESKTQVPRRNLNGRVEDDVHVIENAPKPADTAEGLYRDKISGKIKTYSRPFDVPQILRFEVLKYLAMRYFYMREHHLRDIKMVA